MLNWNVCDSSRWDEMLIAPALQHGLGVCVCMRVLCCGSHLSHILLVVVLGPFVHGNRVPVVSQSRSSRFCRLAGVGSLASRPRASSGRQQTKEETERRQRRTNTSLLVAQKGKSRTAPHSIANTCARANTTIHPIPTLTLLLLYQHRESLRPAGSIGGK